MKARRKKSGGKTLEQVSAPMMQVPQRKQYDLADLVKRITRGNRHKEVDFGRPVGKEAL
jgi:antitoxin component of MazEF toxin-antitoxin module